MVHDALLDALGEWHTEHHATLAHRGVDSTFERSGPHPPGDKPVAHLVLDTPPRLGSLLLWNSGEANLQVVEAATEQVLLDEYRTVADREALHAAVSAVLTVVEGEQAAAGRPA